LILSSWTKNNDKFDSSTFNLLSLVHMKRSYFKLFITFQLLLNSIILIQAQNKIDHNTEGGQVQFNIFKFEGTDKYDLLFPIINRLDTFQVTIKAYISAGDLSIEICNPTGESLGNFMVQGQNDLNKTFKYNFIQRATSINTTRMHIEKEPGFFNFNDEYFKHYGMGDKVAQASISKLFRSPVTGDWVIKVVCNKAKGFFTVENNEYLLDSNMPTKFVNGIVLDNKNRPLAGAIIRSRNGYGVTTTNDKGEFTVSLRDEAETRGEPEAIVVQYKKMIPKEVIVGDQPKITIVLEPQK
jgi:hypothetical protein